MACNCNCPNPIYGQATLIDIDVTGTVDGVGKLPPAIDSALMIIKVDRTDDDNDAHYSDTLDGAELGDLQDDGVGTHLIPASAFTANGLQPFIKYWGTVVLTIAGLDSPVESLPFRIKFTQDTSR